MTTLYHIYHCAKDEQSFSIHSISDSNSTFTTKDQIITPSDPKSLEKPLTKRQSTLSRISTKSKRAKCYDDPRFDSRTETSPYFIHCPKIAFHCPPFTLRHGGQKTAPVAALMHPSWGWRSWRLEFGDVLSQPGVFDRRGVVGMNHGTLKGEDGTLRGYPVRSFRMAGESGKAWFKEQKALGLGSAKESAKVKPEEVVELKWVSPFSFRTREYRFTWRGYDFVWKGTGQARPKSMFRPLLRFNHLKLVVLIPGDEKEKEGYESVLANYTSAVSARKMGRLELNQETIDSFLFKYHLTFEENGEMLANEEQNEAALPSRSEASRQRLTDIIMATGMSMVIGEYQKRQVLIGIILALAEGGGG